MWTAVAETLFRCVIQFVHLLELDAAKVRSLAGQVRGLSRRVFIGVKLLRTLRVVEQVIFARAVTLFMAESILLDRHVAPPARLLRIDFCRTRVVSRLDQNLNVVASTAGCGVLPLVKQGVRVFGRMGQIIIVRGVFLKGKERVVVERQLVCRFVVARSERVVVASRRGDRGLGPSGGVRFVWGRRLPLLTVLCSTTV